MKIRFSSTVLIVLGLSWTLLAQGSASPMRAGMWEVSSKLMMPGMDMPPTKHQQCVTEANIKDPESTMPKMDSNDCKLTNFKLSDQTATYTLTCTQPAAVTGTGEIKYSGSDAYTGTLKLDGGGMALTLSYDAKRIGDCPK